MFNKSVVGFANATCGGWGNLGVRRIGSNARFQRPRLRIEYATLMPRFRAVLAQGGVTQLVMPYVTLALISIMPDGPNEAATEWGWRLSFLLPLLMHLVSALFVLTGRDLCATGRFARLRAAARIATHGTGSHS